MEKHSKFRSIMWRILNRLGIARFTERARRVMFLANQQAKRLNYKYIGTEHILLGLVEEGGGIGVTVLKKFNIDMKKISIEIAKLVKSGDNKSERINLPTTPRASNVIKNAIEESRVLNNNYVGTEHILLGLLRETDGVAAGVLMNLGLKLEDVREKVRTYHKSIASNNKKT